MTWAPLPVALGVARVSENFAREACQLVGHSVVLLERAHEIRVQRGTWEHDGCATADRGGVIIPRRGDAADAVPL